MPDPGRTPRPRHRFACPAHPARRSPWIVLCLLTAPVGQAGNTYHFSAAGNDSTGDGSLNNPWKSILRFNALDLDPGDQALFRAGDTFRGAMFMDANDSGLGATGGLVDPIRVGVYGGASPTDRATIVSPAGKEAFYAYNTGGIELSNLSFTNGGTYESNFRNGVMIYNDRTPDAGVAAFEHIRIDNVAVSGFGQDGLEIRAADVVGYHDVRITNSEFFENQFGGVDIAANPYTELVHRDVLIDGVIARDNPGLEGYRPHSGHGIVMGQVDGGVIQYSVAHHNGVAAGYANGGIWAWQSNDVVIQHNTAHNNRSPLGPDGLGFDLDGGMTNSVLQYNVSYNNDGPGYLVAEFDNSEPQSQNVIRYNLSVNDGRDAYGAISVWGNDGDDRAESVVIHNNTVFLDGNAAPDARGAVWFLNNNHDEIDFVNNVFVAINGAPLVAGNTSRFKTDFINNAYWTDGGPVVLEDQTYDSVEAWAIARNQERFGSTIYAIEADPGFADLEGFALDPDSPLIDAGLDPSSGGGSPWPAWFVDLGQTDLYGQALPAGGGFDLGAVEYLAATLAGDFNGNGVVEQADLDWVLSNWGQAVDPSVTEWPGAAWEGTVDQAELDAVLGAWGQAIGIAAASTIPEPASVAAVTTLGVVFMRRGRGGRRPAWT